MTQILKLSHDLLPTAALVHRYDPKLPTFCMFCRHNNEDRTTFYNALTVLVTYGVIDSLLPSRTPANNNGPGPRL
jgi:hypothetical protein